MYLVYDKNGKEFKVNHAVDVVSAIKTGNYTKLPPGVEEPPPQKKIEGERVEGIVANVADDSGGQDEVAKPAVDNKKAKQIKRQ